MKGTSAEEAQRLYVEKLLEVSQIVIPIKYIMDSRTLFLHRLSLLNVS